MLYSVASPPKFMGDVVLISPCQSGFTAYECLLPEGTCSLSGLIKKKQNYLDYCFLDPNLWAFY